MTFKKVAIIGLGLIGGSLAWALKKSGRIQEVFGVDLDDSAVAYAAQEGMIDGGSKELIEGVRGADVIVVATYVGVIPKVVKSVASLASEGTVITDVGSVKGKIVREVEEFLSPNLSFIGGHPIAGTERSGIRAADFRLFQGKRCILTPTLNTDPEALSKVKKLWEAAGAHVFTLDPETHDRIFGFVSHLPHVVAYALVNSVASVKEPADILDFAGGGLKDYTRIGSSSPEMWSDIFLGNRENVLKAIGEFRKVLEKIEKMIEKDDIGGLREEFGKAVKIKNDLK